MFECRLLGSVEVCVDGHPVDLGPAKQRCVLAVLLVEANTAVSVDQLIDRVWADNPPLRVRSSLHSYLTGLRRAFRSAPVSITRRSGAYVLTVDEDTVDLHRFRRLMGQARAETDDERALVLAEQALGAWRGEPFAGLDTPWLATVRAGLERERAAAQLDHIDVALRCGQHAAMLTTLATLASEHPLDERVAGQRMLALYRAGRQADALEEFRRTRQGLAEELGVDPGPELRAVHEQILRGDPAVAAPSVARQRGRNDLPGDIADFTGREQEMAGLLAAFLNQEDTSAKAVVIEAIDGMAGVGKTALAVHAAHRLVDRYPDAQLFIDLHGHTNDRDATDPMIALDTLLRALNVPGDQIPHALDARAAQWRAELATRKALVVLDNAFDTAQIRPLLPGNPRCLTLITSRRQLLGLDGAHVLSLDVLPRADAITLFTRILHDDRVTTEPEMVNEIMELCGDLPLAIRVAAARLRTRPSWSLSDLAERLRDRHHRLAELAAGDRSVAAAFDLSHEHLTAQQQRMFRLLGLHPGPDIDTYAAASLTELDLETAERVLEDLVDVHLLDQSVADRYRFHDLLRQYAQHLVHSTEPETVQHDALTRLTGYYLHTACAADRLLHPHRPPIQLEGAAASRRPLEDDIAAMTWFTTEHPSLLAIQQLAAERRWHTPVWQLAWALATFHWRRGNLNDRIAVWRAGLAALQNVGDPATQALAHRLLGLAYVRTGSHAEAVRHLQQALTLAEHSGDLAGQAHIHQALAWAWAQQEGKDERALKYASQALCLYQALDLPVWEADALKAVGWLQARLGQYEQGRAHCEAALALFRHHHVREGEAGTLDSLGYIAQHTGRHAQALDYCQQALSLRRDLGNTYDEADTLDRLGQTRTSLGRHDEARDAWQQALQLYQAQHRTTDADRIQHQLAHLDQESSRSPTATAPEEDSDG